MIAAFATLVFLSTLWMLAVIGAEVLDSSGAKILAALKGKSVGPVAATRSVRVRHQRLPQLRPAPVTVRQRAAA